MKFFLVIGRNELYTYERDGQRFVPQYIEGSESFALNSTNIAEDINSYMEILANERNLGTISKLEFELLEGPSTNLNALVKNIIGDYLIKIYTLDSVLSTVINKLQRDRTLRIDMYGINYEGFSYIMNGKNLVQRDFSLLAYTIHGKDVVELMNCN